MAHYICWPTSTMKIKFFFDHFKTGFAKKKKNLKQVKQFVLIIMRSTLNYRQNASKHVNHITRNIYKSISVPVSFCISNSILNFWNKYSILERVHGSRFISHLYFLFLLTLPLIVYCINFWNIDSPLNGSF